MKPTFTADSRVRSRLVALLAAALPAVVAPRALAEESPPRGAPPGYAEQPAILGPYRRSPYSGEPALDDEGRPDYRRNARAGRRLHNGLFIRLAGGIGSASDSLTAESPRFAQGTPSSSEKFDGTASGFAAATEIALGFTPFSGFVLGAGAYTLTVPSAETDEVNLGSTRYAFELSQLALFSPFADYYIDPHKGFHVQGGFGLATLVMGRGQPTEEPIQGRRTSAYTAAGFGFMLGAGYEWWVADEWGAGLLGRVLYGSTTGSDGADWDHSTVGWSLMVTATYH